MWGSISLLQFHLVVAIGGVTTGEGASGNGAHLGTAAFWSYQSGRDRKPPLVDLFKQCGFSASMEPVSFGCQRSASTVATAATAKNCICHCGLGVGLLSVWTK